MNWLAATFSLLTAAAGWFYMFYSRAAQNLAEVEQQKVNLQRVRLRRVGGFIMLLLGALFFAGSHAVDPRASPLGYMALWAVVFALLLAVVFLALIDVRLTRRLRRRRHDDPHREHLP